MANIIVRLCSNQIKTGAMQPKPVLEFPGWLISDTPLSTHMVRSFLAWKLRNEPFEESNQSHLITRIHCITHMHEAIHLMIVHDANVAPRSGSIRLDPAEFFTKAMTPNLGAWRGSASELRVAGHQTHLLVRQDRGL